MIIYEQDFINVSDGELWHQTKQMMNRAFEDGYLSEQLDIETTEIKNGFNVKIKTK